MSSAGRHKQVQPNTKNSTTSGANKRAKQSVKPGSAVAKRHRTKAGKASGRNFGDIGEGLLPTKTLKGIPRAVGITRVNRDVIDALRKRFAEQTLALMRVLVIYAEYKRRKSISPEDVAQGIFQLTNTRFYGRQDKKKKKASK